MGSALVLRSGARVLGLVLSLALVNLQLIPLAGAADPSPEQPAPEGTPEDAARFLRAGQYQEAVQLLQGLLVDYEGDYVKLENVYLLLVETYVLISNGFRDQGDDLSSDLYWDKAEEVVLECLQTRELRHTRPDPTVAPPEMVDLFQEVHNRIFGSFQVTELAPVEATVTLDGDTLSVLPETGLPGDSNVLVGPHTVTIEADGYSSWTDQIEIMPGTTLAKAYALTNPRGAMWYATRGLVVAAGVVAAALLIGGGDETTPASELPEPPPPPGAP